MGLFSLVSGRSPSRLSKFAYGVIAVVSFVGAVAILVGTAILWMKLKGPK